jgi:hypothetical protein
MRIRTIAMACLALVLASRWVAAQSCWPVGILLAVRDSTGARIDPLRLDTVVTGQVRPLTLTPRRVSTPYHPAGSAEDSLTALEWAAPGCHIELQEATLVLNGRVMRLVFDMVLDSELRRGASVFLFEAPRFKPGSFRLRWDPDEPGGHQQPLLLRGRWTAMSSP